MNISDFRWERDRAHFNLRELTPIGKMSKFRGPNWTGLSKKNLQHMPRTWSFGQGKSKIKVSKKKKQEETLTAKGTFWGVEQSMSLSSKGSLDSWSWWVSSGVPGHDKPLHRKRRVCVCMGSGLFAQHFTHVTEMFYCLTVFAFH